MMGERGAKHSRDDDGTIKGSMGRTAQHRSNLLISGSGVTLDYKLQNRSSSSYNNAEQYRLMDSHSAARRAAAERLVRAQFRALPDQLHIAVLTHPFAMPETKALVSQADQIAAAAVAATAALKSPAHGPTAFQALTGGLASGGALHAALRDACAELQLAKRSQSRVKVVNEFDAAKNTADFETLLDALSSFQVRTAGRPHCIIIYSYVMCISAIDCMHRSRTMHAISKCFSAEPMVTHTAYRIYP